MLVLYHSKLIKQFCTKQLTKQNETEQGLIVSGPGKKLTLLPPKRALLVGYVSQNRAVKLRVSPQISLSARKLRAHNRNVRVMALYLLEWH